jgi:HD-like signal output (HDOD) protein
MTRHDALKKIASEVAGGQLHFASNTELALRIRKSLDDPDCHMEAAAKLMQAEPVLSAQVVAIANSVAYNPMGREITDVKTAVTRLGFATLRNLVMAMVTRQMAGTPGSPEQRRMTAQLWEHTTHVAALCRIIAKRVTHLDPDTALFVGLVHEVGGFYLLSRAGEYPALLEHPPEVLAELQDEAPESGSDQEPEENDDESVGLEGELCIAVLRKLNVPEVVITAVAHYWTGFLAMPPESLGDTLLLAEFLAPVASPLRALGGAGPAGDAMIDMMIGEDTLTEILKESAEEVASISRALQA